MSRLHKLLVFNSALNFLQMVAWQYIVNFDDAL